MAVESTPVRMSVNRTAAESGLPRTTLLRYLSEQRVADWLAFDGDTLPVDALPLLRALSERRGDPRFKPKTLARSLESEGTGAVSSILLGLDMPDVRTSDNADAGLPAVHRPDTGQLAGQAAPPAELMELTAPVRAAIAVIAREVAAEIARGLAPSTASVSAPPPVSVPASPPDDRLVGREEAARLLNCTPLAVGRRVRRVARGSWSYLMLQEWIAQRRESAKK